MIREEAPGDAPAIRQIQLEAFGDHGPAVVDLVDALRPTALSLVAVDRDKPVGHMMLSPCVLDAQRQQVTVQTLSPLAILPEYQRRGIGGELIAAGLARSDRDGIPLVFLEGDPAYYSRHGFVAAHTLGFRRPSLRIPKNAFQVAKLSAWEPWMTGTFVYSEVFWRMDAVGLR